MKMNNLFCVITCSLLLYACGNGSSNVTTFDLTGYKVENVGNGVKRAIKMDTDGNLAEEGYVVNNVKNGTWTTYHPDSGNKVKTIASYVNGEIVGPVFEFNNRGQIEGRKTYGNGTLHGLSATYKFGRAENETPYKNGKIDGVFKDYQNGKLHRRIDYKDGKKDGKLTYYDEEGNITVEYVYKNDQKQSGGMIE